MADTPTHEALRAMLAEADRAEAVMLRECGMSVLDKVVLEQARAALATADAAPVPAVPRWHWHDLQAGAHLPPCDQIFVGVNVNGYTCTANATDGDKCWHETPEESIEQMSGLRWWAPYVSPMDVGASSTPAALSVQAEPVADLSDDELDRLWRAPMSADWEHREYARAVIDADRALNAAPAAAGERDVLLRVIQRLNSNPYSLTKSECIAEVEAMRDAAPAAPAEPAPQPEPVNAQMLEALRIALDALTNCTSKYGHRCNRCDDEVDANGVVAAAVHAAIAAAEAAQPEPAAVPGLSKMDAEYWLRHRGDIIDAITAAGFSLCSSAARFWLQPLPKHPTPQPAPAGVVEALRVCRDALHDVAIDCAIQCQNAELAAPKTGRRDQRVANASANTKRLQRALSAADAALSTPVQAVRAAEHINNITEGKEHG